MFEPIIIKLDYSPRDERHSKQIKSVASRLGKRIGRGLASRPNIGKNRRTIGSGRIDIPTGGVRGYKRPTGNRRDIDRDGWADEGTTNPVWVGLSGGRDRPIIETQRARPKINLNNQKIKERKKIRQKIKYGESSLDGKLISKKNGPKWLDGLSNEQISNILVPDSYQTYSQMLADGFGVDKETIEKYLESRWGVGKPWLEIDYSESSTKQLKQALKTALDESPIFSWAVRNYGSPTYTVMTRKSAETYNNRDAVKPLYDALKKMYPDAPGEPQFAASNHLDFEMVTFNPINVVDKKSWQTNEPISSSFQTSKLPSDSDTVIDRSISGTILHEWAHWYHSEMLLANIESSENKKRSPKSLINPQDSDFTEKIKIALEYNSDNGNMNLHSTKKPLEDSPNEPRTITSYGHVSRKEMFAEGMLAYMHPNEQLKLKAINKKLRQDIETILAGDKGVDAWKDSKANIRREKNILSSGRKNRKLTKLSSGSKAEKPERPTYPRHPSYGPFLDGAEDVFADVKNWKEFKEVYDNLEINFFDYETTGLVSDEFRQSSGNGAPVQFGVTKTKGGKEIGRLNIFMNPGEELGDWSRKNLKNKDGEPLTDEWLSSQTSIADAHRKLIEFVGPDAIFGVQNAVFDKTVLEDALTSSGIEWRPKGWVDTKVVSDLVIPKWTKENQDAPWTTDGKTGEKIPSSSLKALTEYLNIDLGKKHHTADADAAATSELMSKIIDKAIEKNWSSDIFDKNWRDQKIKDKLENHQQKIIDFEQEKNNWISETSPKKSTVPKEVEKKEFGFGRLSSGTISYKGRHESPDASSGAPLHNLANGAIYPEDIYGPNGANLYGGAFPDLAQKAVAIFRKLRNKPDSELTIYRAVPRGKNIKEGDWVTILPEYAKIHGDSWLKDNYEIVTKKVKAKELFNEGNSLLEFGYHSKLSSGKYDGAPTYKGKVWKDRKNELDGPVWPFRSQAKQYPDDGPPGISYFKGVVDDSTWVDCLLYRDDSGKVIGILNHYPFALVDPDDPRIVERRGNINIFIDPKHQGKGIATKLVDEAVSRYNVDLRRQRYSEEGANFINRYIRKLPENRDKSKLSSGSQPRMNLSDEESGGPSLSSGATEPIKDIWNGSNKYIQFQTYKNMEIGFTGEARLRDVPSGKRFVRMRVIDSTTGKPRRLENDEVRTFSEKTISAAIDWLLDRQIQTEKLGSVSDGFVLSEEQFKEFLAADINPVKAKPDSNTKKYPLIKKNFKVDEKELLSLSEEKPNNRILVQVTNRFWFDHLSRLDSEIDGSEVRGRFRTEIKLNHSELSNLISDADYYIETARLPDEEFNSMGAEELIDALIKQGVPIENGKLKLSSGSQPRINLSDEEKREIIAIASQRTDDFSKSVVEQFRRNGKLSDRQWNALNKATLRRSRLSSGMNTPELSEMGKQRLQRRIDSYEAAVKKGDGSESKLPWDKNGKFKEKPIIVSEVDDDYDDDEEISKEEKENQAAYREFSKISPAEMARRTEREKASKERLLSPEYLEESRLRRVARNKGKETNTHNADGTLKTENKPKLSSGKTNRANRRANNSRLSSGKNTDTEPRFLPIENLAATRDPNTDTNLQTPAKRRVYVKSKIPKVGRFKEADYPLEVQLSIVEDYKDKRKTLSYIAKKHNVTIQAVLFLARQYNLPYRKYNPKSPRQQRIIEAIKNDMPFEEIMEKFNISREKLIKLENISESAKARKLRLTREKTRRQKKEEKIIKLFNDGLRITEVARLTKMDISAVADVLLANEETKPKLIARRDGSQRYWSIFIPQVRELFKNGLNITQIGKTLKKDIKIIRKIVNEDEELSKLQRERIEKKFFLAQISEELREFFINGGSMEGAIEKFDLSRQQIKQWRERQAAQSQKQPGIPRLPRLQRGLKTGIDSKLSSGKTNRANRRANNSRLSSGRKILPDAIKLTKAEQKILKEVGESGTPDFAKVVHEVALGYDEPGSMLDNMKPTNMAVTMKNARTVSSEIQRQAQESLERAGFPEEFSVWRTAGAGGRPNTGVVSVTTRKGGLSTFKGDVVEYRISRSDVLTHSEGFLGNLQTYAEDELHVDIKNLRRADETVKR